MSDFMGGHYFYTKHDKNAWVHYENNRYYVHFRDKSRNIYLYFVLAARKKPRYTINKEFHFKFIRGYMSINPIDDNTLNKLKLVPSKNMVKIKMPTLKDITRYIGLCLNKSLISPINSSI